MKTTVYINVLILLGGIKTVVLGADDFTVEVTEPCYNDNDTVRLVVQYTGSGSPIAVRWKFSKMTDAAATLDVSIAFCLASAGADPAFPEARMSYSCDGAKKQYNVTISSFDALTDAGIWEAALSVSGSYTNFTSVSVTKCSWSTTTSSNTTSTSSNTKTPTVNASTISTATNPPTTTSKITCDGPCIIIVPIVVPLVALLVFIFVCCWLRRRRNNKKKKYSS